MAAPSILVYTDGEVIGDGILRLSFAQSLKDAAPGAKLTWASSAYSVYDTALKAMAAPIIDELIILPDRRIRLRDYLLRPAILRRRKFDLIIDTQRNLKRSFWLSRIRHRHMVSAAGKQLFATRRSPQAFSPHFLEGLLQLGIVGLGQPLRSRPLALPPGDWETQARALLPEGPRYIGFITGAGHPDKCWPLEKFIALAKQVTAEGYVPVMLLGPQEKEQLEIIRTALPNAIFPLNSGVVPSPYLTTALGKYLTAAVTNDSGGGHLLAAGNTPLVTLFRSATVRVKFMPRTARVLGLCPEDFGGRKMQEIPVEAVYQALCKLLG